MDFSDTDEDSAVENLISQAKDLCVLEQVSAINCSGFTDSVLPTELESRFSKLKSFPVTNHNLSASFRHNSTRSGHDPDEKTESPSGFVTPPLDFSPETGNSKSKSKQRNGSVSSPSNSSKSKHRSKSKSKQISGSFSSPFGSCKSLREDDSPSPPRRTGCFWWSPKTKSKQKSIGLEFVDDEVLSGLGSFSKKEQRRILNKAMKEEEKLSREADKIVMWARQESARINVHGIDDQLSDD